MFWVLGWWFCWGDVLHIYPWKKLEKLLFLRSWGGAARKEEGSIFHIAASWEWMMVNRQVSRIKLNNCWRLTGVQILLGFFWYSWAMVKFVVMSGCPTSSKVAVSLFLNRSEGRQFPTLFDMLKDKYSVGICYIVIYSIYMFVWIFYVHHFSFNLMWYQFFPEVQWPNSVRFPEGSGGRSARGTLLLQAIPLRPQGLQGLEPAMEGGR